MQPVAAESSAGLRCADGGHQLPPPWTDCNKITAGPRRRQRRSTTQRWRLYDRSPRMRRASWMSLGMMVTRLAWMAQRLVSSNSDTR